MGPRWLSQYEYIIPQRQVIVKKKPPQRAVGISVLIKIEVWQFPCQVLPMYSDVVQALHE